MATDAPISASGPIRFSDLKNVFGVTDSSSNEIRLSGDMSAAALGDIGQVSAYGGTNSNALSISTLRNKKLPEPVIAFTPSVNTTYTSSFEPVDATGTLNTNFTYRKRIIQRLTLNNSTLTLNKTVKDRGGKLVVDGTDYAVTPSSAALKSAVAAPLTAISTAIVSKSVPYSFKVQKRNGLEVVISANTVDVADVLQNRVNKFDFTTAMPYVHHDSHHSGRGGDYRGGSHNNQSPCRSMYGGCHTCHRDNHHQHHTHHHVYHHNHNQYANTQIGAAVNTAVTGPDYATFQLGQQASGCGSSSHLQNGQSCSGTWNLTVVPSWRTTAIQFGSKALSIPRHNHAHQHGNAHHQGQGHTSHFGYC